MTPRITITHARNGYQYVMSYDGRLSFGGHSTDVERVRERVRAIARCAHVEVVDKTLEQQGVTHD